MSEYILELQNITKIFPGIKALDNVHFNLKEGEIHALMGENGAGKSTFIKVITGVYKPEEGDIYLDGNKTVFKNPVEAQNHGIAAIYQHVTCYPDLTVTENMFVGHEKTNKPFNNLNWKSMQKEAIFWLDKLNANFSPKARMGDLSVAQQQIVEIAKALSMHAKIIIMDEPTAALTQHESEELYIIAEDLRADGVSIIFISHRMEDVNRLADRVTVFRDSQYIGHWNAKEITNDDLIKAMVGREITQMFPKRKIPIGETVLAVENLSRTGFYKDVSFSVAKGEILALTGLVGAGRTEVCESLYGITRFDSGKVILDGKEIAFKHPKEAIATGLGLLPEDRQKQGLILDWSIAKNITLSSLEKVSKVSLLNEQTECELAGELSTKLGVKTPNVFNAASSLSGGNQQKVVVAKQLTNDLKVIILDEPTKGVDVGAKIAIYDIMSDLAEAGYAVIMISSEMPEVLGMSDRIIVMKEGRVTAELITEKTDQNEILRAAMAGEEVHE